MGAEIPFNTTAATAKWVQKFQSDELFDNQTLFEMVGDIFKIHGANRRALLDEVFLHEDDTPRNFHISRFRYTDPAGQDMFVEGFIVNLVQEGQSVLEEFRIRGNERGGERFTTWWIQPVLVDSRLLGYVLTASELLLKVDLLPEQICQIAERIWNAHAFTLVDCGEQGILGLPKQSVDPIHFSLG